MSMMSSLADGYDTLQPPERNPHGFTLSSGDIPGDNFFFSTYGVHEFRSIECNRWSLGNAAG